MGLDRPGFLSAAAVRHHDRKQPGEEGASSAYSHRSQSVPGRSKGKNSRKGRGVGQGCGAGVWGRGVQEHCSRACSPCFLIPPRATCRGAAPPTVDWGLVSSVRRRALGLTLKDCFRPVSITSCHLWSPQCGGRCFPCDTLLNPNGFAE